MKKSKKKILLNKEILKLANEFFFVPFASCAVSLNKTYIFQIKFAFLLI